MSLARTKFKSPALQVEKVPGEGGRRHPDLAGGRDGTTAEFRAGRGTRPGKATCSRSHGRTPRSSDER